jgi:hypothetical protein
MDGGSTAGHQPAHRERGEEEKQGREIALSVKVGKLTRGKGKKRKRERREKFLS